jgi:hypothetical protein
MSALEQLAGLANKGVFLDDSGGGLAGLDLAKSGLQHASQGTNRIAGLGGGTGGLTRAPHNPYGRDTTNTTTTTGPQGGGDAELDGWLNAINMSREQYNERVAGGELPADILVSALNGQGGSTGEAAGMPGVAPGRPQGTDQGGLGAQANASDLERRLGQMEAWENTPYESGAYAFGGEGTKGYRGGYNSKEDARNKYVNESGLGYDTREGNTNRRIYSDYHGDPTGGW